MKTGIFAALLSLYVSGAVANFIDGNVLLRRLQAPDASLDNAQSIGYIMGIADSQQSQQYYGINAKFCSEIPSSVISKQLADITQRWLEKHPEHRHYAAADLVALALKDAYPCKR